MSLNTKPVGAQSIADVLRKNRDSRRELRIDRDEMLEIVKANDKTAWKLYFKGLDPVSDLSMWVKLKMKTKLGHLQEILEVALQFQASPEIVKDLWEVGKGSGLLGDGIHILSPINKNKLFKAVLSYQYLDLFPDLVTRKAEKGQDLIVGSIYVGVSHCALLKDVLSDQYLKPGLKGKLLERWLLPDGWDMGRRVIEAYKDEMKSSTGDTKKILRGLPALVYKAVSLQDAEASEEVLSVMKGWHKAGIPFQVESWQGYASFASLAFADMLNEIKEKTTPRKLTGLFLNFVSGQELLKNKSLPNICINWRSSFEGVTDESKVNAHIAITTAYRIKDGAQELAWLKWVFLSEEMRDTAMAYVEQAFGNIPDDRLLRICIALKQNGSSLMERIVSDGKNQTVFEKWFNRGAKIKEDGSSMYPTSGSLDNVGEFCKLLTWVAEKQPHLFFVKNSKNECLLESPEWENLWNLKDARLRGIMYGVFEKLRPKLLSDYLKFQKVSSSEPLKSEAQILNPVEQKISTKSTLRI